MDFILNGGRNPMTEIREIIENLKIDIEHFTADIYEKECFFSRVKELEQTLDKAEADTKRLDSFTLAESIYNELRERGAGIGNSSIFIIQGVIDKANNANNNL